MRQLLPWMLLASLVLPSSAFAHARLEKAEPAKRAELKAAPAKIRLNFNEAVEAAYSRITVTNASGETVESGALAGSGTRSLELALPPLPAGEYRVRYRVLSVDGHVIEADYPFRIKPGTP